MLSYLSLFQALAWLVLWIKSLINGQQDIACCAMMLACVALCEIYGEKGKTND